MATNGGGVLPNCQKQHKTKKNTKKKPKKILAPNLVILVFYNLNCKSRGVGTSGCLSLVWSSRSTRS